MDPLVRISGLSKRYGQFTAVDRLDFDIFRNEVFGLLGPNGAGKTTTISMICGLLPATGGQITFSTPDVKGRSYIGYCPQENIFYPRLTCMEQMVFTGRIYGVPGAVIRKRSADLLGLLGLEEKAHSMAGSLSGGMKRRLNICMALVHDPAIIVLDEPEAGLDPQSRILVRDFIKSLGRAKSVILTTHNMDEADRLADRVAIIDHGRLLMLDTPRNLKKTIGEGDILEITAGHGDTGVTERFAAAVKELSDRISVTVTGDIITARHPGIIGLLQQVRDIAVREGLQIAELRLRENTLEDVFIHLTGRSLRQ